jgi:hypothetical protein
MADPITIWNARLIDNLYRLPPAPSSRVSPCRALNWGKIWDKGDRHCDGQVPNYQALRNRDGAESGEASAGLPPGRPGLGGKVAAPADGLDCIPAPVMSVCRPGSLAGPLRT